MLYDRLVDDKIFKHDPGLLKMDGTQFSNYMFMIDPKEFWKLEDFDNCFPPADDIWIEFKAPHKVVSDEMGTTEWDYSIKPTYWGWQIKLAEDDNPMNRVLSGQLYEEYRNGQRRRTLCTIHFLLNEKGKFIRFPKLSRVNNMGVTIIGEANTGYIGLAGPPEYLDKLSKEQSQNLIGDYTLMINPALLAFSQVKSYEGAIRRMAV